MATHRLVHCIAVCLASFTAGHGGCSVMPVCTVVLRSFDICNFAVAVTFQGLVEHMRSYKLLYALKQHMTERDE